MWMKRVIILIKVKLQNRTSKDFLNVLIDCSKIALMHNCVAWLLNLMFHLTEACFLGLWLTEMFFLRSVEDLVDEFMLSSFVV